MSIQSIEDQIVLEYGNVKGWLAIHVYWVILGALFIGWIVGRL